jgi:hypothetical protein
VAAGNVLVIASANPASPPQQAMRMSRTPRCLRSFVTDRQNEAASRAVAMSGGVLASLVIAGNDPRWKR